jgi:asparagine synthase (glutamine-hydrolysing)
MAEAIRHRGPDDGGAWVDNKAGVALGHRRLSIVDLSKEGHQPMHSACGRYVIVFNGEIYNFREIRRELEDSGAAPAWRGHSDTEVMLAAVSHWGLEAAVRRFVGMFAFALWDRQSRVLHLVRDRLGEKPLYYGRMGSVFMFASELKALRMHPGWRGEINRDALVLLLKYNYVPAPYTIYKDVFKLLPGTILSVVPADAPGNRSSAPAPYWSAVEAAAAGLNNPFQGSDSEAVEHLDGLLRDSVRRQMVADVPLGAFLSGGIDSSTIVALMQAQAKQSVKTFTIGFNEEEYNEAEDAKRVAHHLGTDHTELYVSPKDAMAVIPKLPALYDEPFSDVSQIPTFLVAQLTRKNVTVSLSGDGGDELFGGYNRYVQVKNVWSRVGHMPKFIKELTAKGLTAISPENWDMLFQRLALFLPKALSVRNPGGKLHKLADVMVSENPFEVYLKLASHWYNSAGLVLDAKSPLTLIDDPDTGHIFSDITERMMCMDTITYLPDDILVKVDRASMGVSLESRAPFLDHRVVEFAWRTPLSMKIRDGAGKWLLRQVLYNYVPRHLVERPKMGFAVPIDSWLRGPLRAWAEDLLDEKRLRNEGFFNPGPIRKKWLEHLSGKRDWQYHLWDVLMFQSWLEAWGK